VLRIFASGFAANMVFVATGLFKQYLVASSLTVADFGAYGSLVAIASLLLVLIPFPTYLNVMIRGFSAPARAFGTRKNLILAARHEIAALAALGLACIVALSAYALLVHWPDRRAWPLVLLLFVQYITACLDLLLRMQQAHRRLALFMVVRNIPAVALLFVVAPRSPLNVAAIDFATALMVAGYFLASPELRIRAVLRPRRMRWRLEKEQLTLWLARLTQFSNSSLLRLLVPLAYGAHETGLFFFALIAQLPCSLFLSVTTQLYGHTLARLPRGDWATLWRTQGFFLLPNLVYAASAALLLQHWAPAIARVPSLAKYADAGPLVLAVVVYSTVLASDCQEYLLRARGLSRVLLMFSASSVVTQLVAVGAATQLAFGLRETIYLCAAMQAVALAGFSTYSFKRVVG
jgi:hypothetical protein